jgi:hypothetical protein
MGTKELFVWLLIAWLWVISLIWIHHLGWKQGYGAAKATWKAHGDATTEIWRKACIEAWNDLVNRPV